MKSKEEFIKALVSIDKLGEDGVTGYGHYPFQMVAKSDKPGNDEMYALALGGNVHAVYKKFFEAIKKKADRVYLSIDFPAQEEWEIEHDFVPVYAYEGDINNISITVIPYDPNTGEIFPQITEGKVIEGLQKELAKARNAYAK